ncbi:hypothetical protein BKA61DRAFT_583393 [Leptodontidium sp. MPI-SDFR-AT-0119]|nr:hypothetical protein BKA61DRAFT_583393 [Leptodontidium sp. MPI-SDFR-AT-0119]
MALIGDGPSSIMRLAVSISSDRGTDVSVASRYTGAEGSLRGSLVFYSGLIRDPPTGVHPPVLEPKVRGQKGWYTRPDVSILLGLYDPHPLSSLANSVKVKRRAYGAAYRNRQRASNTSPESPPALSYVYSEPAARRRHFQELI